MRRSGRISGNGREAGVGPPIFWSAAAHLLVLLATVSLFPGSQRFSFPGVVEVLLVPTSGGRAGEGSPALRPVRRGNASATEGDRSGSRVAGPVGLPRPVPARRDADPFPPEAEPAGGPPPGPSDASPIPDPASPGPARAGPGIPVLAEFPTAGQDAVPAPGASGTAINGIDSATGGGQAAEAAAERAGRPLAILRARIRERIEYPAEAVRRGQEGEVLLRIRIGPGGVPREIRVARSSGTRILDEAARSGVVRAAPLPSDPGWFEIPVRFSLR